MANFRKTYGITHLIEWCATFSLGKTKVKVWFKGGQTTYNGVIPATATTSNPIVQFAVENSPEFKNGLIKITSSVQLKDNSATDNPKAVKGKKKAINTNDDNIVKVEVSVNDDAREYLEDNFGIAPSSVRTKDDIMRVALEHGIEFVFVK